MAALDYSVFGRIDDADNNPLSGGKLRIYTADTTSLASTYSNAALSTPLTNPVVADSAGRLPPIYIAAGTYDLALLTSADALVDSFDDYVVPDLTALDNIVFTLESKTADYTILAADAGKVLDVNADSAPGASITITAEAATLTNGFPVWINNVGTTGSVVITPDGGETIDGASTWTVAAGWRVGIVSRGASGWRVISEDEPSFRAEPLGAYTAINTQTDSYTLVLTDKGKIIEMNKASANNLTVPLNSSVAFPTGTRIDIVQYGAGQTTVVATGGVTIRSASSYLKIAAQYAGASLYKRGTDEWVLVGSLTS